MKPLAFTASLLAISDKNRSVISTLAAPQAIRAGSLELAA